MKYQIINIKRRKHYIEFELDGYVEFNDRKQMFVYTINAHPFTNYQKNEEIEIDRSAVRRINANSLINNQQGVISQNYASAWNPYTDYNEGESASQISNREKGISSLDTVNLSAHERKAVRDIFLMSIEWLEKYIEVVYKNEFPNWENRKQIRDKNIKRTDIYQNPQKLEESLSTSLFLLESSVEEGTFRDELKQEFYKWISAVGIDVNNCPERLKHYLFGVNEMLEGRGGKILKDAENRKRDIETNSPEYLNQMGNLFANTQVSMRNEREVEKSLKGKNYRDIDIKSKFGNANVEDGEKTINQITNQIANKHDSFHFYPQNQQQNKGLELLGTYNDWNWLNDVNYNNVKEFEVKEETCYLGEGTEELTSQDVDFANQKQQELIQKQANHGEVWAVGGGVGAFVITAGFIKFFGRSWRSFS